MKMKIKLWVASADAEGGTQAECFVTGREGEDWIIDLLDDEASRETYDAWQAANPDGNFFDFIDEHRRDGLDTFNLDISTVEIDVPMLGAAIDILRGIGRDDDGDGMLDAAGMDRIGAFLSHEAFRGQFDGGTDAHDIDLTCGQCEGTGTVEGGLGGDGDDEQCPVCNGKGQRDCDPDQWPGGDITGHPGYEADVDGSVDMAEKTIAAAEIDRHEAAIAKHGLAGALERALGDPSPPPAAERKPWVEPVITELAPVQMSGAAPDGDDLPEGGIAHLVSDALVLLDAIGWSVVPEPGQVRFLTIPVEGDEGTIWRATITKES